MLRNAEHQVYRAIGKFSTIALPSPYSIFTDSRSLDPPQATQCTAFLCSSREFIWFVESWDVNRNGSSLAVENKKVYPAKVMGLSLASPLFTETVLWREGLIGAQNSSILSGYRPGFGQYILSDAGRPIIQQLIPQTDLLGTGSNPAYASLYGVSFSRQLGRLMSMAFYVDPVLAAKYDASQSKKKKKSLNSQDYEQIPTYPTYDTYNSNPGGY